MKLIYTETKEEVRVGDKVETSRGLVGTIDRIDEPHKPSSTGRIYIRTSENRVHEYFPSVIDAEWVDREDQSKEFVKIKDEYVHNIWQCDECKSKVTITPDWYQENGTPLCCDLDMDYSHTEINYNYV